MKKILQLGCGTSKRAGAIGVDVLPLPGVDVVHNLNSFPYPFADGEFDLVIAEHVLEHLDNLMEVMEEIHKILKPGGRLEITCPHFSSADTFTDITHKHFITSRSFDYFVNGADLFKYQYSQKARFKIVCKELGPRPWPIILKPIAYLINKFPVFYERRFAMMFPIGVIYIILEKLVTEEIS